MTADHVASVKLVPAASRTWGAGIAVRARQIQLRKRSEKLRKRSGKLRKNCGAVTKPPEASSTPLHRGHTGYQQSTQGGQMRKIAKLRKIADLNSPPCLGPQSTKGRGGGGCPGMSPMCQDRPLTRRCTTRPVGVKPWNQTAHLGLGLGARRTPIASPGVRTGTIGAESRHQTSRPISLPCRDLGGLTSQSGRGPEGTLASAGQERALPQS